MAPRAIQGIKNLFGTTKQFQGPVGSFTPGKLVASAQKGVRIPSSGTYCTMNSIDYQRDSDNTNTDDGTTIIGDDVEGGVPTWTWGVIGGVVVVAFIVGAFILSRGGEGDEGKDWDY